MKRATSKGNGQFNPGRWGVLCTPLLLTALGALAAVGCTDFSGVDDAGTGSTGTDGGSGNGGDGNGGSDPTGGQGGTGATAGSGPQGGTGPTLPSECPEAVPGSRLLRRLTRSELLNSQQDVFGDLATNASAPLPGDSVDRIRLSNDASILVMSQDAAQAVLDRAEEIADAVTEVDSLSGNLPCSTSSPDDTCASEFIDKYGEALFRRPLDDADRGRYLALHQSVSAASDFATGLKWTLVALMQSPFTVYRSELGEGGKLTPYELASELSYDYSASPPSAELLAMALAGDLDDPEVRYQEAKKLLSSERGDQVIQRFFEEWLNYRDVLAVGRENTPGNFESVRPKMVEETELFLEKLLFEKDGTLADLLTADFTVADAEVAQYYGFSGGSGDLNAGTGEEVKRDWGLGIFAQGSVTTTMSSITITSPTRRGLLLLRRLYCSVPGLPEAQNFDLTADSVSGNTTRERLEQSHLRDSCQTCHVLFDPLGFGFEHIDHVGRWRDQEQTPNGSFPIDATATVATLGNLEIDGQEELMRGLAEDPSVMACISGTMASYVYGGGGSCRAPETRARAMSGETSIVDFLAELAREPHFVQRN